MLGEMTHMYGNIFEMKARIVEYLYKELDFTTIAMESSMYDLWLMNKNGFDPDIFNDAIWGVWSGTEEFQRLVKFIEKNKIKVIGFDSQISNNSKFIEDFFDFIENNKIDLKVDEDDLGIVIEGVLEKFKKKKQLIIKEENICTYSKVVNNRNYASSYFRRIYSETLDVNDILDNSVLEIQSDLFDFETKNVEEIEYEFYKKERKQTV